MRTYIDVHVLQTVPPSNLNRDDAGSPKQAVYGGVRRSRVSSQAWKRATRQAFEDMVSRSELGTRTRKISALLINRIEARGIGGEAATRIATQLLGELGIKSGKKETDTAYLLFFGRPQLDALVEKVADRLPTLADLDENGMKEALADVSVRAVLGEGHPIDVALFGRMVADIPNLNVDAAVQVAHALSTHAVETEFDYYTAVDDENTADETGAGMIGTLEFTSATLYRYATVGLHQLVDNLGDSEAALQALRNFLMAFTTSMPTGHQNSYAHRTIPNLVTIAVRTDQPSTLSPRSNGLSEQLMTGSSTHRSHAWPTNCRLQPRTGVSVRCGFSPHIAPASRRRRRRSSNRWAPACRSTRSLLRSWTRPANSFPPDDGRALFGAAPRRADAVVGRPQPVQQARDAR